MKKVLLLVSLVICYAPHMSGMDRTDQQNLTRKLLTEQSKYFEQNPNTSLSPYPLAIEVLRVKRGVEPSGQMVSYRCSRRCPCSAGIRTANGQQPADHVNDEYLQRASSRSVLLGCFENEEYENYIEAADELGSQGGEMVVVPVKRRPTVCNSLYRMVCPARCRNIMALKNTHRAVGALVIAGSLQCLGYIVGTAAENAIQALMNSSNQENQ